MTPPHKVELSILLMSNERKRENPPGYLAHKKQPPPLGRHRTLGNIPTVGSEGGAVSYDRGTQVELSILLMSNERKKENGVRMKKDFRVSDLYEQVRYRNDSCLLNRRDIATIRAF